jgi:hypothetical protein
MKKNLTFRGGSDNGLFAIEKRHGKFVSSKAAGTF